MNTQTLAKMFAAGTIFLLVAAGAAAAAEPAAQQAREQAIRGQIVETIKTPKAQVLVDDMPGEQADAMMKAVTPRLDSNVFGQYTIKCKDGITVSYRLFQPAVVAGKKYPLVIYYNGAMNEGNDNVKQLVATVSPRFWALPEVQRKHPCCVLVPQMPANLGKGWKSIAAAEHKELYDLVVKTYGNIDRKRVYLAGFSAGGSQVYNEMSLHPDLFAAGLASDGTGDIDNWPAIYVARRVRLMMFCGGSKDPINPKRNGLVLQKNMEALGGKATCIVYPNLDHWQVGNTFLQEPGVLDWLFAQHK